MYSVFRHLQQFLSQPRRKAQPMQQQHGGFPALLAVPEMLQSYRSV